MPVKRSRSKSRAVQYRPRMFGNQDDTKRAGFFAALAFAQAGNGEDLERAAEIEDLNLVEDDNAYRFHISG